MTDPEATRPETVPLLRVADEVLGRAREASAGRAARTLTPGAGVPLTQTVLALTEGSRLHDHRAPGHATIQVLRGDVRLRTDSVTLELSVGQWAEIPDAVHDLVATTDAAVLLTVGPRSG